MVLVEFAVGTEVDREFRIIMVELVLRGGVLTVGIWWWLAVWMMVALAFGH